MIGVVAGVEREEAARVDEDGAQRPLRLGAQTLDDEDVAFHESEVLRLRRTLEEAGAASALAEEPTARDALHDLLLRIRLG